MRIEPVTTPYAPNVQALFDRLPASWSPPFKLFTVLARDERLLLRWTGGAVSYLEPSHLTVRQREVLLLRVTARSRCAYEWGMRVHYFAGQADLSDDQIYATVYGDHTDPGWSATDMVLIRLADELHDTVDVCDQLWTDLKKSFSDEAIMQLLMMAGYYRTVAYVANGLKGSARTGGRSTVPRTEKLAMRIQPPIPPYSAEVQAEFELLPRSWQPPFQHYGLLGRDPRLLRAYRLGSVAYLDPSHITVRQREVFLLRVTGRCQNAFEWTLRVHYFADDAGLTEAQLRASVHGSADDRCWQYGDRILIRLADELHDTATISDALWQDMRAAFTDEAILQLLLLAGHYRTNAYVSKGLRVPVESRVKRPFPVEQTDV